MTWTTWDRFQGQTIDFWKRRIARIVPVYWVATSMGVALLLVMPNLYSTGQKFDWPWVLASYAFQPWPSPTKGDIFSPVLGLGWTLNYEMYFYAIFGIAMLFRRGIGLLLITALMVVSAVVGSLFAFETPVLIQNTSWLLLEFCMGMAVAVLVKRGTTISTEASYALAFVAGVTMLFTIFALPTGVDFVGLFFSRTFLWGFPCALLVYTSLMLQVRAPKSFVRLGDASYSIYLFHIFALPTISIVMARASLNRFIHMDILIVAMTALAVAAGVLCYHLIEKPLRFGKVRHSRPVTV